MDELSLADKLRQGISNPGTPGGPNLSDRLRGFTHETSTPQTLFTDPPIAQPAQMALPQIPSQPQTFKVRDNFLALNDLEEAKAILFGEVSNRPLNKQILEAQTILNTALNRMEEYRRLGKPKTLTEVLQMPNQYQAFKGKEYNKFKDGKTGELDKRRIEAIEKVITELKDGTLKNNIPGYFFYSHRPDGSIQAVKKPLFKK